MPNNKCFLSDRTGKFKQPKNEEEYDRKFDYYADKAYFISMAEAREKALRDVGYTIIDCPWCVKNAIEKEIGENK